MRVRHLLASGLALIAVSTATVTATVAQRAPEAAASGILPALGADPKATTVSGISSGAFMAGQYQIANSASVAGAAIIAGGPYGCAEARFGSFMLDAMHLTMNASQSIFGCMKDTLGLYGIPDVPHLADEARRLAASGRIDPVAGLSRHRIYLFSGGNDSVVKPRMAVTAAELYLRLGVPREQIKTAHLDDAGHGFVTVRPGANACSRSDPPYVVRCGDYDQAHSLLSHFYDLPGARTETPSGDLVAFDQRPYSLPSPGARLSELGRVFIPKDCRDRPGCRIHIAFHGCKQNHKTAGDAFVRDAGFLNWADTNRIVVLFPDVAETPGVNPLGCWDWWGYTGFDYLTRDAAQIASVRRMVERLASRP